MEWKDILGMVISTTSVVITVISVYVAYLLSRNYLQYIKEMDEIRDTSAKLNTRIAELVQQNAMSIKKSTLAIRSLFDLLMLTERLTRFKEMRSDVVERRHWKGKQLSEADCKTYLERVDREIQAVVAALKARQTELYWLVSSDNEQAAHLHALASTHGDTQTIRFLSEIRLKRADPIEREELLVAVAHLRQRLGKVVRTRSRKYDSRGWTG